MVIIQALRRIFGRRESVAESALRRKATGYAIASGVWRFDRNEEARKSSMPSMSFYNARDRETPYSDPGALSPPPVTPEFEDALDGASASQVVRIQIPKNSSLYGTGEVPGRLLRNGKKVETWNTDCLGYSDASLSLYQSHPWVLCVMDNGKSFGILADTTCNCQIDMSQDHLITVTGPSPFPILITPALDTPQQVVTTLGTMTGKMPLPPKWAVGYHQCRWSYEPASQVVEIADGFRSRSIPCDAVWMDIDYMSGFRCFTFDPVKFPDPVGLRSYLNERGFHAVWMLDPGLKAEPGYSVYESGSANDVWVRQADGSEYHGVVWPGDCAFPDYLSSEVRHWWSEHVASFMANGVDGLWNDMNEPAIFHVTSKTMPLDNVHEADPEFGGRGPHSQFHNVYGMQMVRATREGMLRAHPNKRPFVLTRANYIGGHRYAATWTGDNVSTWTHLQMSIPMVINLGISGQPFTGPDIGGFAGNCEALLFARWIGLGALLPFSRTHTEKGSARQEPWTFGEKTEAVARAAIMRRYLLLPHIYSLFYRAHISGLPVLTPMFFADPADTSLRDVDDAFLLGNLAVLCSVDKSATALQRFQSTTDKRQLASGRWARFHFDDFHPELPLLFLKEGSIIPTGPPMQFSHQAPLDPLTLLVYPDASGAAEGKLYEDTGDGYEYEDSQQFLLTKYTCERLPHPKEPGTKTGTGNRSHTTFRVKVVRSQGAMPRPDRALRVRLLLGDNAYVDAVGRDGQDVDVTVDEAEAERLREEGRQHEAQVAEDYAKDPIQDRFATSGADAQPETLNLSCLDVRASVSVSRGGRLYALHYYKIGRDLLGAQPDALGGYEEYSSSEYRSAGCAESYRVIRHERVDGASELLEMEGELEGGLVMSRVVEVGTGADVAEGAKQPHAPHLSIHSSILGRSVEGGGASRSVSRCRDFVFFWGGVEMCALIVCVSVCICVCVLMACVSACIGVC
eukprot:jgi/Mesvir1/11867/Mv00214-RA.2